jgi:hypothetical protein
LFKGFPFKGWNLRGHSDLDVWDFSCIDKKKYNQCDATANLKENEAVNIDEMCVWKA